MNEPVIMQQAVRVEFDRQISTFVRKVLPDYGSKAYLKLEFLLAQDKTLFNASKSYIIKMTELTHLKVPATLKIILTHTNLGTPYEPRSRQLSKAYITYKLIDDELVKETNSLDPIIQLISSIK